MYTYSTRRADWHGRRRLRGHHATPRQWSIRTTLNREREREREDRAGSVDLRELDQAPSSGALQTGNITVLLAIVIEEKYK